MKTFISILFAFVLVEVVFYLAMGAALREMILSQKNMLEALGVGGITSAVMIGICALLPSNKLVLRVSVFLILLLIAAFGFFISVAASAAV